ncbi:IS1380 family transposase [Fimbriiglobus ruber]|uniref:Transposase DDE domain-containing protein n=1 Tax=Fimbriiglobus ruber TaxID=1908690 RepID=A0A225DNK4_9BACT|nr:IS1380 family transposase [Fimbriiglobus ruber]OWK37757.1 hypothetical protein FRUB_06877 [Fimbriiglobus ruber]
MNTIFRRWFRKHKTRLERRLQKRTGGSPARPVLSDHTLHYEVADQTRAIPCGGIGLVHQLVGRIGLVGDIDDAVHVLKTHLPYHESDHVLTLAYNALCGGTCRQDIDRLRNDAAVLDALGATRIPDPTTAGDFGRRFHDKDARSRLDAFDRTRRRVWAEQPDAFFDLAVVDADGTIVETAGRSKQGPDITYDGRWGDHPLVLTLANTGEVLSLVNRPGNRPSHEGAAGERTRAATQCLEAGFRKVLFRGDTDFSQTACLDGWNAIAGLRFVFGYDAKPNLVARAEELPAAAWQRLIRPARYAVATATRQKPADVRDGIVRDREYETLRLQSEDVAEFAYRPTACAREYRMVVVRKTIARTKGQRALFDETRYFFDLTNEREWTPAEIVFSANDRCHQENLIAPLKGGVRALSAPTDTLASNWVYMVMTALAWSLKAWWALMLPDTTGRWQDRHRDEKRQVLGWEFRTFVTAFVSLPCQVVTSGRRRILRVLSWNPHLAIFFRLVDRLRR